MFNKNELIYLPHNSPAWYKKRAGRFTSSSISLLGKTMKDSEAMKKYIARKCWETLDSEVLEIDRGRNYYTNKGHQLEPVAFQFYSEHKKKYFGKRDHVFLMGEHIASSPDTYFEIDNSLLEIKTLTEGGQGVLNAWDLRNKVEKNKAFYVKSCWEQIQHQIFTAKADFCDLLIFAPTPTLLFHDIIRIDPCPKKQAFLKEKQKRAIELKKEFLEVMNSKIIKTDLFKEALESLWT